MTAEIIEMRHERAGSRHAPSDPPKSATDLLDVVRRLVEDLSEWHDEDPATGRGCYACTSGTETCPTAELIEEAGCLRARLLHPGGRGLGPGGSVA